MVVEKVYEYKVAADPLTVVPFNFLSYERTLIEPFVA
jgi:hypothetical protein